MINLIITGPYYFTNYNIVEAKLLELGVDKQEYRLVTDMKYGVNMMGFDFSRKHNKEIWIYHDMQSAVKVSTHCIAIHDNRSEEVNKTLELVNNHKLKLINIVI